MKLIHYSSDADNNSFNPNLFREIQNSDWEKPIGGLWTCPINAENNWYNFCTKENNWQNRLVGNFVIELKESCKLLTINSLQDLEENVTFHMTKKIGRYEYYSPDFVELSKKYDAIYLTFNGQIETRIPHKGLFGWDIECVLVMNPYCVI